MNNLGELFRRIRQSKNWSIREAAKIMGISYSYLSILEKGRDPRTGKDSNPKPDTLRLISKAYEYPYEELLKVAGYLNPDIPIPVKFDHKIFKSNLKLIMGKMTVEELSSDIFRQTNYNISPNQIQSYIKGDIEPFPGTINILSKYAKVSTGFWYVYNSEESFLEVQKNFSKADIYSIPYEHYGKGYTSFSSSFDDIKNWMTNEKNIPYIKIAIEAQKNNINPESLMLMINAIVQERSK